MKVPEGKKVIILASSITMSAEEMQGHINRRIQDGWELLDVKQVGLEIWVFWAVNP